MQYRVVIGMSNGELNLKVEEYLQAGWKLQGGVAFQISPTLNCYFAQAVIGETEDAV